VLFRYNNIWHLFWHVGYLRHQQQVDLLTLKVSESRVTWATSVPIIVVFQGLSVFELGPMYMTDRRQTKAWLNASPLWGWGITIENMKWSPIVPIVDKKNSNFFHEKRCFSTNCNQNRLAWLRPDPAGELTALPTPLVGCKGPISTGWKEGNGGKGAGEKEGKEGGKDQWC